MTIGNIKLSQNEQLLANALLSMLGGAIIGTSQGTYQYLITGNVSIGQAVAFAMAGFWAAFSVSLYAYVPAHIQQELATAKDVELQLRAALDVATTAQPVIATTPQQTALQPSQSPVTIHINGVPLTNTLTTTIPTTLASVSQSVNSATPIQTYLGNNASGSTVVVGTSADIGPIAATPEPDITGEDTAIRPAVKK
jgi:hypothetical protein